MRAEEVIERFRRTGALLEGHFILTSGLHSPKYLQCALVLQHPPEAEAFARAIGEHFAGKGIETVVAPAIGGIVIGYEVARSLGARSIWTEREAGVMKLRRGFGVRPGESVLVVEDVVTTGGSAAEVLALLRGAGARLEGVGALIDRSGRPAAELGLGAPFRALLRLQTDAWPPEVCPLCASGEPLEDPGSSRPSGKSPD